MSALGDDFSESSYEGSSTSASMKDEPPTLDETLLDNSLFVMFLNYMKSQQAVGNLMFLKDARKFRMINEPHDIVVRQAAKIILTYFSSASEFPVSLSDDAKKALIDYAFDPSVELRLDKNTFSVAFSEVYNTVVPHFRNWITTEEWREAVPFHHLPPPTFSVVLSSSALRFVFNKFLKSQLDRDDDKSAIHAFQLWKFCLIANDFREGKYTHDSHLESKKKKKGEAGDGTSSEKSKEEEAGKKESPEEYAKRIYKKYKHQISLPYDKTMPYAVFIIRSLDQAIEEFDKSALFARWIALKQYQGVDYQAKIMHQSLTPEGYAEPPTLAAAMTSSILPAFLAILQGTEQGLNVEFLTNVLLFHRKFAVLESDGTSSSSSKSQGSSSSSGISRKDMVEEAKRIFSKFLESGEMYCDPGLVEEVRTLINKNGGKSIAPNMFRKIGAFIYHRSEHTWVREAVATFEWVNRNYDNRSRSTQAVLEEFALNNLPEGFDLQIVPSLDDIYANSVLFGDYSKFVDEQTDKLFEKFLVPFAQYFKTPIRERKPILQKLASVYVEAAEIYPELKPSCTLINKEVATRDRVSDVIVRSIIGSVARAGAARFYKRWIVEHSMVWKTAAWTSATEIKYGDLSLIMGMSAVESKIEEAALKGKSGFSRYLAKRQLKKQSIATIRGTVSATALQQKQDKTDAAAEAPKEEEEKPVKKEVDVSTAATVPTFEEVLSSLYLRKFFERGILDTVLNPEQKKLWEAFFGFFKKYDNMFNEQVANSQEEMLKDIIDICDQFKDQIPNSEQVKERAKKQKFLFPIFFRPEEHILYEKIFVVFEGALRKRGWKSPQN